jgi:ABC-2 type transport system permease protein
VPVHDLGYRKWTGQRASAFLRPLVIARGGISLILKRRWLRIMLVLAWLPVILPAFGIFAFEYSTTSPGSQRRIVNMIRGPLGRPDLVESVVNDPANARHEVWSMLILAYFRYPQLFAMVTLIGLIAPLLVSYDLRTKAYLMYFSRPLSPSEYILGKSAVIWFFLAVVVTVPALLLYLIGVLLSPDLSVVMETWDIVFRILAASVVLMIPTTMLAVFYSSLTSESRYATFAWFATWIMGSVAYQFLTYAPMQMSGNRPPRRGGPVNWEDLGVDLDRWRLISPYHTLGKVEGWVFGLDPTSASVVPAVCVLVGITVIGFWIVRRRIIARLSV